MTTTPIKKRDRCDYCGYVEPLGSSGLCSDCGGCSDCGAPWERPQTSRCDRCGQLSDEMNGEVCTSCDRDLAYADEPDYVGTDHDPWHVR